MEFSKLKNYVKKGIFRINNNPLSRYILEREIYKRSQLSFQSVEELSQPINIFSPTYEIHAPNDWYGHAANLKNYLGFSKNYSFKFIMEHGLYLNDQVDALDLEANLPTLITYSNYRKEILKKYRQNVFTIGPFIHYAKSFLSEKKLQSMRKKDGKVLLFFPAHSTSMVGVEYDVKSLCNQIRKIGKGFDKIRVCMYWKDVLLKKHLYYLEQGFECVTAGHMLDPNFLPRLKSLISLSDLTASNIISSQAGFCIYLNKPHILLRNKFNIKSDKHWKKRIEDIFVSPEYKEVAEEFSKLNFKISSQQRKLVKKHWGTNNIKTKSELKRIVKFAEECYKK